MADTRTAMMRLSALVGERALFENEAFRRFWVARLLANTPGNAVVYMMLLLVVSATGKAFSSSIFVAAYLLPSALLGTVSGVMIDRAPKGLVLGATNAARAALAMLLAISTDDVVVIYVLAVLFAVAAQFSGPAEGAALPSIVAPEEFTSANSLNNLGALLAQMAGIVILPAVFLKTVGPEALAVVAAVMFGLAAAAFLLIEGLAGPISDVDITLRDTRERFAEAWQRLHADSVAYVSVIVVVLADTTGLVVVTLLPRYAKEILGVSMENVVFIVTPAALGIWLALRFVRHVSERISPWWSIGGPFAALVGGVVLLAFVPALGDALQELNPLGIFDPGPFGDTTARIIISMALAAALAFAYTFVRVVGRSIVNERIPREMQGRVLAAQSVLATLASIPPILLTGLMADRIGIQPVFFIVGLSCGIAALFYSARSLAAPVRPAY